MHRANTATRWSLLAGHVATFAGVAVRRLSESVTEVVGLPGAALVCYGLGEIYDPLLPISAGAVLLLIARHLR